MVPMDRRPETKMICTAATMHGLLTTFLNAEGTANVMAHARLLLRLSRRFETIAPAGLARLDSVATYKSGKVVLPADNGALATKIRQMSQRPCDELSKGGSECNGMEVKTLRKTVYQSMTSTTNPLSNRTFDELTATAEGLPAGGLREALRHLLERAAREE